MTAVRAFELRSIELESRGLVGVDVALSFDVAVTVRRVPDGTLPDRFDAGPLPVAATGAGSLTLDPIDHQTDERFPRLTLVGPVEVPRGRLLVQLELRPVDSGSVRALDLVGRRGAVGGTGECVDHNPEGAFLLIEASGAESSTVLRLPDPEVTGGSCRGSSGPAAFNITMRLEGPALSDAAAEELDRSLLSVPAMDTLVPAQPAPAPAPPPVPGQPAPGPAQPAPRPAGVTQGASCGSVGAVSATAQGLAVRCTEVWGRRAWRPIPDAVAVQAHEELLAWFRSLPPGGAEVPIERHPAVPEAYEQRLRLVLDVARRAHTTTDHRWIALLYPHDSEGVELAIERAIENTRPADREALRIGWAEGMREVRCVSYNQVGRNPDTRVGFIIATIPVTPRPDCQMETPDQVAAQLVREYLMGVGGPLGEPCWAGEGAGWPMGRAVMEIAGGPSWQDDWGFWVGQILPGGWNFGPSRLGLRRSTEWGIAPERQQYCYDQGTGHIQGSLAHEMLIVDHGLPAWVASWRAGTGVRGASGLPFDAIIERADARFIALGGRIG